jgi:CheY-like chemotaxis protein
LEIILDIPSDANIIVSGDPNKFRQVLINLVKNAVKFTKEGSVTISAQIKDGKQITVAVADTGIGISEENRSRLFNSFMQADASTTRRYGGTGLGLALSRNLVKLMHGTIEMYPNKGGGSVFSFTIPFETAFAVPAPEPEKLPHNEKENPEELAANKKSVFAPVTVPSPSAPKPLILIVEDNPVNQNLFAMIVDKLGYPSILADDGFDALDKVADNPVGLVLMDIQMPRMNGYEATETLRKRGFKNPVIAVTASALSGEREHCMEAGFNDILLKPFTRPDIAGLLDKWVNISREKNPSAAEKEVPASLVNMPADVSGELVPENEIFDKEYLIDSFIDDMEIAKSLLAQYLERTESQIEFLPSLIEKGDWERARREAHTIKGSALTVGGRELGKTAGILESACMNGDTSSAMSAMSPALNAFKRFKVAVKKYLDEA